MYLVNSGSQPPRRAGANEGTYGLLLPGRRAYHVTLREPLERGHLEYVSRNVVGIPLATLRETICAADGMLVPVSAAGRGDQLEHAGLVSLVEVAVVDAQSDVDRFSWPEDDPALTVDVEAECASMAMPVS